MKPKMEMVVAASKAKPNVSIAAAVCFFCFHGCFLSFGMNDSFCPADHYNSQENVLINQKTYAVLKPQKVQNLDKTIESLWYAQANQKPNNPTNFSIDKILNTEQKHTLPLQNSTQPQGQDEKYNSQNSSRASSHSFEVLQYPSDSRTPLSMKKAASSAAKSHHLETRMQL